MGSSGKGQARAQTEAGTIQADTSIRASQGQSTAAQEAAEMRALAFEEAAGVAASGFHGYTSSAGDAYDKSMAAQEESFQRTQDLLNPFTTVGDESLEAIKSGATNEGFAERLKTIMDGDVYRDLVDNRMGAADARLTASGSNRSGAAARQASEITAEVALGLDNQLYQRQMNNVNIDYQASNAMAGYGQQNAQAISGMEFQKASLNDRAAASAASAAGRRSSALANGIVQAAGARATGVEESAFFLASGEMGAANAKANALIGAENAKAQGRQNRFNNIMGAANMGASLFASDERLKENMQPIGKVANLTWYEWDWKPHVKGVIGCEMSTGFGASEVQAKYPDCVHVIKGVKVINYPKLHNELKQRLAA